MLKDCLAVLDIGTSSINLIVGEKSVNGSFSFRVKESIDYYAFYDGEFTDVKVLEEKLVNLFKTSIENSELSSIGKVYVGVPGEFHKVISKNYRITFNKFKSVGKKELSTLFELGFDSTVDCEYSLIHRSAVYYMVDNIKTHAPIGKKCSSLGARLSYSLVSNNFKEVISNILSKCGVKTICYISSDFALSQYLFSKNKIDECKILIDVGSATTSLSISCGDGLLFSSAFALGGGLITAYLSDTFKKEYEVCEKLKRKLNLGLKQTAGASYYIDEFKFDRNIANNIAKDILNNIAEKAEQALSSCPLNVPSDVETYFTGGGICLVRGAVEYISNRLGVLPKTIAPKLAHYGKPNYSSQFALLYTAHKYCNDKIFFT